MNTTTTSTVPLTGVVRKPGLTAIEWVALILMIIGGLNWGLVGAFGIDVVAAIFGPMSTLSRLVYCLVGLSALCGIWLAIRLGKNGKV